MAAPPREWAKSVRVGGRAYHLIVTSDTEEGGYVVQCRELPGALEQGDTSEEAIANGKSAIASVLSFQRQRRGRLVQAG